jgi:tRNA-dihydrouridine synthase A
MLQENLSVAPMMEITDAHFRCLLRGFTKKTVLYTEMVVDDIIHHGANNLDYFLGNYIEENPSVIQLGGYDPEKLASAAAICEQFGGGYSEININCGCPSPRVSKRSFGAKLMLEPDLVREIVATISRRVQIPVTIKCRIGVDCHDSYEELLHFIRSAHSGGANKFVIHARKCILKGLTTKQNRDIPPLKYEIVHRLVKEFPDLTFILNGGLLELPKAHKHMQPCIFQDASELNPLNPPSLLVGGERSSTFAHTGGEYLPAVHGVMMGRAVYNNPLLLTSADSIFFGVRDPRLTRREIIERYIRYCEWCQSDFGPRKITPKLAQIISTATLLKPMHNIVCGIPRASAYKTRLNDLYIDQVKKGIANPSCREVVRDLIKENARLLPTV